VLALQVERSINLFSTSSCGRLFDVVAAIGGGRLHADYEAQGAIEMEMVSRDCAESYPYDLRLTGTSMSWGKTGDLPPYPSFHEINLAPLLRSVIGDVFEDRSLFEIGSKFHRTIARMAGEVSRYISEDTGLKKVVLSGGCFQNRLLLRLAVEELLKHKLQPLLHHQAPSYDGGISLGQAVIGHFTVK
jgi:hydrogenase maturation protein HypF